MSLRDRPQQLLTGLLAAVALLGADAAVLHSVLGMLLALVAAALAGLRAGLEDRARVPDTKEAAEVEGQLKRLEVAATEKSAAAETNGKPPDDGMSELAPLGPPN